MNDLYFRDLVKGARKMTDEQIRSKLEDLDEDVCDMSLGSKHRNEAHVCIAALESVLEERREERKRPCDLCGVLTLPDFLEDVSAQCGRERKVCEGCCEKIDEEERDERRADDFNARQVD